MGEQELTAEQKILAWLYADAVARIEKLQQEGEMEENTAFIAELEAKRDALANEYESRYGVRPPPPPPERPPWWNL